MRNSKNPTIITEHKIGKVTYIVRSAASEKARDTLDVKIEKMIKKRGCSKSEQLIFFKIG